MDENSIILIDGWQIDASSYRIARNGNEKKLEPRSMELLLYLIEHPDRVVTREEIETNVWHGRVVGYDALSAAIAKIRKAEIESLPKVSNRVRIGPCVGGVGNFLAIGTNYADHSRETGDPIPDEPIVFNKAPSCIVGPNDNIVLPRKSKKTDWEVELALVIGRGGSYIDRKKALSHVAGYTICHDVSERDWQLNRGGQFIKGKGCPTCYDSGYKGRIAIHEVFDVNASTQELMVSNPSRDVMLKHMRERGVSTLFDSGMSNVLEGHTTIDEVLRVAGSAYGD